MNTAPELVSLRALARALGISASWLRAEAEVGGIPSLKAGRRRLYNLEAVRAVLVQRAAAPPGRTDAGSRP